MTALIDRSSCAALIITCSDFRIQTADRAFAVGAQLTDDYDLIARPGAIRSLVQPRSEAMAVTMREEMRLLHGLHGFARVLMVNHVSCRAYDDIATPATEMAVHTDHLMRAAVEVEALLEGVHAEAYIAGRSGEGVAVTKIERV